MRGLSAGHPPGLQVSLQRGQQQHIGEEAAHAGAGEERGTALACS